MGMDVFGIKPTTENGKYFRSNLWSWRPIHFLCEYLNEKNNLGLDLTSWEYNDGAGLNSKQSKILAKKLEQYLDNHPYLKEDDDRMYICLGCWSDVDNKFVDSTTDRKLSKQYKKGTVLYSSVVTKGGKIVTSSHSTSLSHFKNFITFLNSCGGFSIH